MIGSRREIEGAAVAFACSIDEQAERAPDRRVGGGLVAKGGDAGGTSDAAELGKDASADVVEVVDTAVGAAPGS
jgi:hypothetical protein